MIKNVNADSINTTKQKQHKDIKPRPNINLNNFKIDLLQATGIYKEQKGRTMPGAPGFQRRTDFDFKV